MFFISHLFRRDNSSVDATRQQHNQEKIDFDHPLKTKPTSQKSLWSCIFIFILIRFAILLKLYACHERARVDQGLPSSTTEEQARDDETRKGLYRAS